MDNTVVVADKPQHSNLMVVTEEQIQQLGQGNEQTIKNISDRLLGLQRVSQAGELGQHLNQIMAEAKGLDPNSLQHGHGLASKIMGMFHGAKDTLMARFDTVKDRIDELVKKMDEEIAHHQERLKDIDDLYQANIHFFQDLQDAQAKGKEMITSLNATIEETAKEATTDTFQAAKLADLKDRAQVLEKRVDDFGRLAMLAEQSGPSILIMKQNARQLIDTFRDLKTTTIPAWTNLFTQYILSNEQKEAADFAGKMYDTTDEVLRRSADLQGQTAKDVAATRQRSVITIEALQYNQQKLLETIDAVKAIEQKGHDARVAAQPQLKTLEAELIKRLA